MKALFLLFVAIILVGCFGATPYQPIRWNGGYMDSKVQQDTWNVGFNANGNTSITTANNYLLYRCAEITVQNGFDYFVVTAGQSDITHAVAGPYGHGYTVAKPSFNVTIKCGKGSKPEGNYSYDAREIMSNIGPKIKRK